jgi:hypothetical protein
MEKIVLLFSAGMNRLQTKLASLKQTRAVLPPRLPVGRPQHCASSGPFAIHNRRGADVDYSSNLPFAGKIA